MISMKNKKESATEMKTSRKHKESVSRWHAVRGVLKRRGRKGGKIGYVMLQCKISQANRELMND